MTLQFLDLYKQLEQKLIDRYENKKRHYSSAIMEFIHSEEGAAYKDRLDLCREVRNLLSHHALIDGENLVTPSHALIETLKEVILYLDKPPLLIDVAVPATKILKATLNENAYDVMEKMKKYGYSHIPVIHHERFYGVFSSTTPFYYLLKAPFNQLTTLNDLKELLPIEAHDNEIYVFVPKDLTLSEAREIFTYSKKKNKRTVALFVSEDGSEKSKLLAMATPIDVLEDK